MIDPRSILVVASTPSASHWRAVLERAGFHTTWCPGPTQTPCPRLGASRCALRETAAAALVELQAPGERYPHGEWHEHACTRVPDDDSTVFVAGPALAGGAMLQHPLSPQSLIAAIQERLRSEDRSPRRKLG